MSYLNRHTSIIIGGPATGTDFLGGAATLISEDPNISNAGWDTLTRIFALRRATLTAEELAGLYPIGTRISDLTWWIACAKSQPVAPGVWLATVEYRGWAATKPKIIKVGAVADSQSDENVAVGASVYAKVETHENSPTVSVAYFVPDITAAGVSMSGKVGTAQALPDAMVLAVPDTVWISLAQYIYHYPNGWVLMGSDQDRLPGCNAAFVTDTYKFIRAKTPG